MWSRQAISSRESGAGEQLTVLYDGNCRLCMATVERLRGIGSRASLRFISLQELDGRDAPAMPAIGDIPQERLMERMHAIDGEGRVYAGSDAVVRILRTVPYFGFAGWLYRLPGMSRLGDAVYRYVARRRYDWFGRTDEGCSSGSCELPRGSSMDSPAPPAQDDAPR